MNLLQMTGQILQTGHQLVITVRNYATSAIPYGSIVILDATNNDTTQAMLGVKTTTSADSTIVCGVICEPGGIPAAPASTAPPWSTGRMCVYGLADVLVVSGSYSAGAYLGTSTTAGSAATGTFATGSKLGKVWANAGGTVTTTIAFISLS